MMIREKLVSLLVQDFHFREQGEFLRQGVCPSCGKKELYAPAAHPWVLRCGRLNKCGAEIHVKELYPDLFNNWSRLYPSSEQAPNATADAYLRDGRGFDLLKLKAWNVRYTQENYWDKEANIGSAVVRFPIAGEVSWERIIDRPERFGSRKATFKGKYGGMWWQAPDGPKGLTGQGTLSEVWIVEGIFDAIALMHHDVRAVSILSCVNYPATALAALAQQCARAKRPRPILVWALDNDTAGREHMSKHMARAMKDDWVCRTALVPGRRGKKIDWNDAHQLGRLEARDIQEYRYQGDLFRAATPMDKALLMYRHDGMPSFNFEFDRRIYWWKYEQDEFNNALKEICETGVAADEADARQMAAERASRVVEICNCYPRPLYYIKSAATDEAWYFFRIEFPHDGSAVKDNFTASQLASASEFKKRLLHVGAGAIWAGNSRQLDALLKRWTFNIKTVETIDFIGYSMPHKTYVFNTVAVHGGKVIERNEEDYFEVGKLSIKSLSRFDKMEINTDPKGMDKDWFERFYLCFGTNGLVVLAFWFGTLFAEQIRARFESFPFLEIVGEPGAGKTTLLETLWKLFGRDSYEGFDPLKSSHVGFLRSMAQVSNLPVVLIESDRDLDGDGSRGRTPAMFHWDSLKSLYNGGSLRTTGVKSSGNDTHDPQFRAALVVSQNAPVAASTAIMERIVHVAMDKSHQTEAGRDAALALGRMAAREVSNWLLQCVVHAEKVLALLDEHHRGWENALAQAGVRNQRIQKNYAQMMVLLQALALVTPMTEYQRNDAVKLLTVLAVEREKELARDHAIVERFWEMYDYLNGVPEDAAETDIYEPRLNHSRDKSLIAVNMNHFAEVARNHNQQIPDLQDLKKYLHTSRGRKFVGANVVVSSAINERYNARNDGGPRRPVSIRCWIFKEVRK